MNDQQIIIELKKWLGKDGISFFRQIKEKHGTVNACWIEGAYEDPDKTSENLHFPGIPHPVHFREGMQVRNFLRRITSFSWTDFEYDNQWSKLVEKAIVQE